MADFNINYLRKDMGFIEDAISVSNVAKKKTFETQELTKITKKVKNLKYFLKKKRNVIYKPCPRMMTRAKLNTTQLDLTNQAK